MSSLDALRQIAPPPTNPAPLADWDAATSAFAMCLPADYVGVVRAWGAGTFDDFISVFAPGHPNPNLDLVRSAKAWSWALEEQAKAGERHPFKPQIDVAGLLAWGVTTNGDPCFWHLRSEDPAAWIIAIQEARGPRWHIYDGGLVDFLVAVLTGRERVSLFPKDVPSDAPRFARL